MDCANDVGAHQRQNVIVALQIASVSPKPLATESALIQLVLLDHRTHRTVEQHNSLLQQLAKSFDALGARSLVRRHDAERRSGHTRGGTLVLPTDGVAVHAAIRFVSGRALRP